MASSKSYLDYIMEQLAPLDGISCRAMMGEYILYCRGRIFGGIYDNRLLVKPTPASERLMPNAPRELPYEGAKEMLLICEPFEGHFLNKLIEAIYEDLPKQKKR